VKPMIWASSWRVVRPSAWSWVTIFLSISSKVVAVYKINVDC
jgi:hypothetical protein